MVAHISTQLLWSYRASQLRFSYMTTSERKPMSGVQWLSQLEASLFFAHQANIQRYKNLLGTYLSDAERMLVEQRLAEEQRALDKIAKVNGPQVGTF